ncbi:MAG: ABC transporter ATP-binding protein [Alphaproteobacteria bacterium]|nr:ABC transporter ATP-binding protein [Alphaproteobacteria bacterium]
MSQVSKATGDIISGATRLSAKNLRLVLGDGDQTVTALNDVSLSIAAGEFVAVVGPSGSGKSSLLAVCGGLRSPTSGSVLIGGVDLTSLPERARTQLRSTKIGFVFQQSNLVSSLSAIDQLLLMVHVAGRSPTVADRDRARALLAGVGLDARRDRRPGQLSGGENQRVGIARALMNAPEILLVDEPTSMLDHNRGAEIVDLLARQTKEHSVGTLMVTHDPTMLGVASRVLQMDDGKFRAT